MVVGRKRKINKRRVVIVAGAFILVIFLFVKYAILNNLGQSIDHVSVPVLTAAEKRVLTKYDNSYHLKVAYAKGLSEPLTNADEYRDDDSKLTWKLGLVKLTDNRYYEIPYLSNSLPYLQNDARDFLNKLGRRFNNRLDDQGLKSYRFSVTSILRTLDDQKKLRKHNVNATQNNSSHYYGRTFDIAQTRFFERGEAEPVYSYRLRNLLLRDLIEMQNEGLCYVLLETQTKCIHVTVR